MIMNIIDPYILLGGDEITPTTRYWYTLGVAIRYTLPHSLFNFICKRMFQMVRIFRF